MGISWAIIFGCIGCIVGFFSPALAYRIATYKQQQREKLMEPHPLDSLIFKITASIVNGAVCGTYAYFSDNLVTIPFILIFNTIAILFSMIDWRIRLIPNEMILITAGLGILYHLIGFGWESLGIALICMISLLVVFVVLGLIMGLNKIGAGDVKLIAVMGLILGYPSVFAGLLVMSIILILYISIGMIVGKLTHVSMFPYAPFMMLGMVFGLLYSVIPL